MTERWRLLEHYAEEAGRNMAVDEALLLDGSQGEPVLRLYSFGPPALSLGYFQRFDYVPAAARLPHVVRRMTGGGAIHHAEELTFSIAAPADHPIYCGEVSGSYERVHAAIASALARFEVEATLRGDGALASDRAETGSPASCSSPK